MKLLPKRNKEQALVLEAFREIKEYPKFTLLLIVIVFILLQGFAGAKQI